MIQVAAFSFFHQILIFFAIIIAGIVAIVWGIGWAMIALCRKIFSDDKDDAAPQDDKDDEQKKTD